MNAEKTLKKRIDLIFGILCLPIANLVLVSVPMGILELLRAKGLSVSDYVMDFIAPQVFYPVLNLITILAVLKFMPLQGGIKGLFRPLQKDFLPWLGFFLGAVALGNTLNNLLTDVFERLSGIELPPVFSEHNPTNLQEGILFFFTVALLPAISEEFLFRAFAGEGLRAFHPGGAVILSAFAFGMAHATLQQIPFAVFMGLAFGLVYIRTGNLFYPVLLHFVNNSWACTTTFLQVAFGKDVMDTVVRIGNLAFLFVGVVSFLLLKEKKAFSFSEMPKTVAGKTFLCETFTSVGFWAFTGLYAVLTVAGLMQ